MINFIPSVDERQKFSLQKKKWLIRKICLTLLFALPLVAFGGCAVDDWFWEVAATCWIGTKPGTENGTSNIGAAVDWVDDAEILPVLLLVGCAVKIVLVDVAATGVACIIVLGRKSATIEEFEVLCNWTCGRVLYGTGCWRIRRTSVVVGFGAFGAQTAAHGTKRSPTKRSPIGLASGVGWELMFIPFLKGQFC